MSLSTWSAAIALVVCVCACQPVLAAITPNELIKAIRAANIWSPDYKIQAIINGEEADISTYRNPKATDKDCKIDAVLVARAAMNADKAGIKRVKVTFYDATNTNKYRQVVVREGDVKAFASRELTPDELLGSIEITSGEVSSTAATLKNKSYQDITQSPGVVEGPYKGERIQLLGRIDALKERGVGVQPFVTQFLHVEDLARNGDAGSVAQSISFLSSKLDAQEQAYNEAHQQRYAAPQAYTGYSRGSEAPSYSSPYQGSSPAGGPGWRGGPGAPPGPGGPGMFERMRQELGDLAPAPGPSPLRRYRIARKIMDMRDEGKIVDPYMRLFREIEDLAAGNDVNRLDMKLQYAEHELGLPSFRAQQ